MPDSDNGRVTLAIIQNDIRHLTALLEAHMDKDRDRDAKFEKLEGRVGKLEPTVRTLAKVMEIVTYLLVVAAVGGIAWAIIQSGNVVP